MGSDIVPCAWGPTRSRGRPADGRVLVTGYDRRAEVIDPDRGTIQVVGRMSTDRVGHTATLLRDGRVLVTGGARHDLRTDRMVPLASVERHGPRTGRFRAP